MLPLDLHVLSLPLAFILSQDQTLHCKRFDLTINLIKINVGYNLLLRLYLTINITIYSTVTFHLFKDLTSSPKGGEACNVNGFEPFHSLVTAYIYLKNSCYKPLFYLGLQK